MTSNLVLDPRQRAMLAEMGVRVWLPSDVAPAPAVSIPVRREPPLRLPVLTTPPATVSAAPARYVIGNWPSAGDFDVVFLGEPCTGNAEKLLTNLVRALGFKVFVAHMMAAHNDPSDESELLPLQLAKLPVKMIVALGPHAARALLGEASGVFGKLRGVAHNLLGQDSKVVVTYHPLQMLRQPLAKAQTWLDLKIVMKEMK